jgi:hypothetical protein
MWGLKVLTNRLSIIAGVLMLAILSDTAIAQDSYYVFGTLGNMNSDSSIKFESRVHASAAVPERFVPGRDFAPVDSAVGLMASTDLQPAPDPSVVDLAVFYAQELFERGRSFETLDATIEEMVRFANDGLASSGVSLTIRVTYAGPFSERLEGIDTILAHGMLGEQSELLRDTLLTDFGADAVILIKATDDVDEFFGFATLGTEHSLSDPLTVPRAVVCLGAAQNSGLECFGRGGIFAHELGHLFGAGHQRNAVGGSGGAFGFSFASECGGGTIVYSPVTAAQQIYSTPSVVVDGEPCGVSASEGSNGTDNAFTIDLTRALMADLRPTMQIGGTVFINGPGELMLAEGEPGQMLTIRRTGDLTMSAAVTLADISSGGIAADLRIDPSDVTFGPGEEALSVRISAVDDAVFEATEVVTLGLRNPLRLEKTGEIVHVSIADNDDPPTAPAPPPDSGGGGLGLPALLFLASIYLMRLPSRPRRK